MIIKTFVSPDYVDPELHVCCKELDDNIQRIRDDLQTLYGDSIVGTDINENRCVVPLISVITFYALGQRVIAKTQDNEYNISKKLYELEAELGSLGFIRISKSEIVNIKKVKRLDMSFTGTIKIIMTGDYETNTSRRNVAKIKQLLSDKKKGQEHEANT